MYGKRDTQNKFWMADQFQDSNQLDAHVASPVRHDEE